LASARATSDRAECPRRPVILVADDDDCVRCLLERGLEQAGFEVRVAKNGREAVDLYRQFASEIEIVLLDVRMPEVDGPQALAALRKEYPAVRCCFISGHSGCYTPDELLSMGAQDYFRKPFSLQALAARLSELVRTPPGSS
jgi:DNA-binding response OmpR family regulator